MTEVFPAPDHNHARCAADVIAHAVSVCTDRSQRLTPMRRKVLEVLASSHKPLGAYEIIDAAASGGPRPAPITIYRALDFLMENGLVHRIESRNAFLACAHNHDSEVRLLPFSSAKPAATSAKPPASDISASLSSAANSAGFRPKMSVVEITGTCAHCSEQRAAQT